MNRVIIFFFILLSSSQASTLFAPDGDTALLLQILGQELEATAGILELVNVSSETLEKIQEVHTKASDLSTRAIQTEYYLNVLSHFPENMDQETSMVSLRNNLYQARDIYNDRNVLTLGYDILDKSNKETSRFLSKKFSKNKFDKKLAAEYLKKSGDSLEMVDGVIYGARASALSALNTVDLNESLNMLNYQSLIHNDYLLSKERKKHFEDYKMKERWGMIPVSLSFEEYLFKQKRAKKYDKHKI